MIKKLIKKIKKKIIHLKNKNNTLTILSNNCAAGFLYKEMDLKYSSPTIGLQILPDKFIEFCNYLERIKNENWDIVENIDIPEEAYKIFQEVKFPIGRIENTSIYILST